MMHSSGFFFLLERRFIRSFDAPEISEDLFNDKEVFEFVRTTYRNQENTIWRGHKLAVEAEILTQQKEKEYQVALTKRV
jgi:hypothetical protein